MILFFILLVTSVISNTFTASVDEFKTYKDYRLYKVEGSNGRVKSFVQKILDEIEDLPYHSVKEHEAHMLIAPELVTHFEEAVLLEGLVASIEVEDYSEIIRLEKSGSRATFGWKAYYDVDDIYKYLKDTSKSNSKSTELIVGGQSYEGRKILGLRINTPTEKKEDKPVVFIESGIHAREWITPATTTYFINELLTNDNQNITNLRDQFDWRIFPTVNPDGYQFSFTTDRMWRKTRSKSKACYGADANRNWDYNWMQHGTSSNPCNYQTYGGSQPFSEVETKSLSEYIAGIENLLAYVAFHSDAQMLLMPYSDSMTHSDNYGDLVKIGNTSMEYGYRVNGVKYRGVGTAAEILYPVSGGSMDWVRHTMGTPLVFTYELRGNGFHWPPEKIDEQGNEYTQMMLGLFDEAKNLGYY